MTNGVVVIDGDRLHARLVGACVLRRPRIARVESHLLAMVESGAVGDALVSAAPVVGGIIQKAGKG